MCDCIDWIGNDPLDLYGIVLLNFHYGNQSLDKILRYIVFIYQVPLLYVWKSKAGGRWRMRIEYYIIQTCGRLSLVWELSLNSCFERWPQFHHPLKSNVWCLENVAPNSICSELYFQACLHCKQLWWIEIVSFSGAQTMFVLCSV